MQCSCVALEASNTDGGAEWEDGGGGAEGNCPFLIPPPLPLLGGTALWLDSQQEKLNPYLKMKIKKVFTLYDLVFPTELQFEKS